MAKKTRFFADKQWQKIKPLLPSTEPGPRGGRRWANNREVFEGILWVLKTAARWRDLPGWYPSASTCWRRLKRWEEKGIWLDVWRAFLSELDENKTLDWEESFIDGSFAPAKKGAKGSARPKGAKARSGWWWSTAKVFLWEASLPRPRRRK